MHGNPAKDERSKLCQECPDKKTAATKACLLCWENLCDDYAGKHATVEEKLNHKIYPIARYMFCDVEHHDGKGIQSFCLECSTICCPHCIMNTILKVSNLLVTRHVSVLMPSSKTWSHEAEDRVTKSMGRQLENGRYLKKTFRDSIKNIKEMLRKLLQLVEIVEEEIGCRLADNMRTIETMSNDMKEYMESKVMLRDRLGYLLEQASDPEVVGCENELPKYETSSYKQVLKTASIDVPEFVTNLRAIQTKLDQCQKDLDIGWIKHNTECVINKPISTLFKISDFTVGNNIYGLAVDSVREKSVVSRQDTTAPITVYDFQGQQLQVLGQDVEDVAGSKYQGIAIDTKRDLYILPMTDGSLVSMDTNGLVKDKIKVTDCTLLGVSYIETAYYVTSIFNKNQVYIINPETNKILTTTVTLTQPYNVHCDEATPVTVVSNWGSHCIKVLDMSGHLLHTYGKEGKAGQGDGELHNPE